MRETFEIGEIVILYLIKQLQYIGALTNKKGS